MPERVVHALEMVEIEIEHREPLPGAERRDALLKLLVEQRAVGQAGQRIVMRQKGDSSLGRAPIPAVADHAEDVCGVAFLVTHANSSPLNPPAPTLRSI